MYRHGETLLPRRALFHHFYGKVRSRRAATGPPRLGPALCPRALRTRSDKGHSVILRGSARRNRTAPTHPEGTRAKGSTCLDIILMQPLPGRAEPGAGCRPRPPQPLPPFAARGSGWAGGHAEPPHFCSDFDPEMTDRIGGVLSTPHASPATERARASPFPGSRQKASAGRRGAARGVRP